MNKILEELINESPSPNIILKGKYKINFKANKSITLGQTKYIQKLIEIKKQDIIIDGSDALIELEMNENFNGDIALFYIVPGVPNVHFQNVKINVVIHNTKHITKRFYAVYNTSQNVKFNNCNINIYSDKQANMTGIFNYGEPYGKDIYTYADNMVISNSTISVKCCSEEFPEECTLYGIYNFLANSISVQNTNLNVTIDGDGNRQKAIGIYTSGRYGRFVGNNIKANGSHPRGMVKEKAYACAFINDGTYSIITSNNIVGEWAGTGIGLDNRAEFAKVSANKILSTHTVCGRSIKNNADRCTFNDNIITSTSRNPRLIESCAGECIICSNYMEVFARPETASSGCGIYMLGERVKNNIIKDNNIKNLKHCGIFAEKCAGIIKDNIISSIGDEFVEYADPSNKMLLELSDEKNIVSLE